MCAATYTSHHHDCRLQLIFHNHGSFTMLGREGSYLTILWAWHSIAKHSAGVVGLFEAFIQGYWCESGEYLQRIEQTVCVYIEVLVSLRSMI